MPPEKKTEPSVIRITVDGYDLEGPDQTGNVFTRAMAKAGLGADCQATPQIFSTSATSQSWIPDPDLASLVEDYQTTTGWIPTPIVLILETGPAGQPSSARAE